MIEVEHEAEEQHNGVNVESHNGVNVEQNFEVPVDVKPPLPFRVFWDKVFLFIMKSANVYSKDFFLPSSSRMSNWFLRMIGWTESCSFCSAFVSA